MESLRVYAKGLPSNIVPSMGRSALYSFTASLIFVNGGLAPLKNMQQPLISACVAAIASLLHALLTPFFNYIFDNENIRWYQEPIKLFIGILAMDRLVAGTLPGKLHFFSKRLFQSRLLFLSSNDLIKTAADFSVPVLNWTIGWRAGSDPYQLKNWLAERGVDFTTKSNAVFLVF
ncbi:MAG: hypothetical protein LW832_01285 [Parachlamydia sp.]|jgi:hypothetical protein|nr:hypothetical protein [Parachlamydia sp.]